MPNTRDPDASATYDPSLNTILLVDDNDVTRIATKWFLSQFGYQIETARNAEEALTLFNPRVHDLVITDNLTPGMTGAEMAHIIKMRCALTPVIMYTGKQPEVISCLDSVIQRPTHLLVLKETVDKLLAPRCH